MEHLISIDDLSKGDILKILKDVEQLERKPMPSLLKGKILAALFFEPSTRTRLSTEAAILRLGGQVIGFSDRGVSSTAKGETLQDTARIVSGYADIIAIRHPEAGSAKIAADNSDVPVINCGDGPNQHPTQTLLDLYTIKKTQGRLDGLKIAMVGDLKYGRTVHSLASALCHFDAEMILISPEELQMPKEFLDRLDKAGIRHRTMRTIEEAAPEVDILYMTRVQKERFDDPKQYERLKDKFILTKNILKAAKKNLAVMHPLPRVNEISAEVDGMPCAQYFSQARNGLFVRQAVIAMLLGKL